MKRWEKLGEGRYQDEHHWVHLRMVEILGDDEQGYLVKLWELVTPSPEMPTHYLGVPVTPGPSSVQVDTVVFLHWTRDQIREFFL